MALIDSVLAALDERQIARVVGLRHDEARMRYPLHRNTVGSFDEFDGLIAGYYNHHFTSCVSNGGGLSHSEAAGRAKSILTQAYRRHGGDLMTAFNDACDGTNGGLRVVLDTIAEGLKAESVAMYVQDVFDRHVAPNSWETKVEIIRTFIRQCGPHLASSIRVDQPERYAHGYRDLIHGYVEALKRSSSMFRRL